jgi:hypothetical protein
MTMLEADTDRAARSLDRVVEIARCICEASDAVATAADEVIRTRLAYREAMFTRANSRHSFRIKWRGPFPPTELLVAKAKLPGSVSARVFLVWPVVDHAPIILLKASC